MPLRSGGGGGGVCGLDSRLLIWVLFLLSAGFWALKAGRFDLVLRALGSVWSACGASWGLVAVLWAGGEECVSGRRCGYDLPAACCLLLTYAFY